MKKILLCTALLAAFPVFAADVPATGPASESAPEPAKSALLEALTASTKELQALVGGKKENPIAALDRVAAYQFTEPTRAKLIKVFGTDTPYTLARVAAPAGMVRYDLDMPARTDLMSDGLVLGWSPLKLQILLDNAARKLGSSGTWDQLTVAGKTGAAEVRTMALEGKQVRGADDVWRGKSRLTIALVNVVDANKASTVLMEELSIESSVLARGKAYDVLGDFRVKTIKTMGEQIDGARVAMRISNVDLKGLEALGNAINKRGGDESPQQQLAALTPQFKAFGKGMARRGTAFHFDEISAGYKGNRAVIKGQIALAKSTVDRDFDSMAALGKKIVARFELRLPLAIITDIARGVTRKQAAARGEADVSAEALNAASQSITDVMVGKALTSGYARVDNGVLISSMEFKAGKLTINGKALSLPTFSNPAAAKPAPAPAAE